MAVDLLGHRAFAAGEQQLAFQEAAAAGLRSLELLASSLSPRAEQKPLGQIADQAVSRFRRVINLLDRTGHARFRRAPPAAVDSSAPATTTTTPSPAVAQPEKSLLTLDFTKPAAKASASAATSTSFLSSVTVGGGNGEGSVSKGQSPAAVSCGKPPLPTKRKQHPSTAPNTHHGGCHCSRTKNSKRARKPVTRTVVRVPVGPPPSAAPPPAAPKPWSAHQQHAAVDVPADEHSWRKYGQKPIKGSPFPRGYYRCSAVKGCPARKHVERDAADPGTLLVTYEGEHRHQEAIAAAAVAGGDARVVVA